MLGLLFGEDVYATTTDVPEVFSFQHKLIQEYLAAVYIAENINQDVCAAFIADVFPTWEQILNHKEVVQFTCGLLATTDASPLTNHVAKVLSECIQNRIDEATVDLELTLPPTHDSIAENINLLTAFQTEGGVPLNNTFLTWYPKCGFPLADILANTNLVYISDTDEIDKLQINASHAQIILNSGQFSGRGQSAFVDLCKALHSVDARVTVLDRINVGVNSASSVIRNNLRHFSHLKCLRIGVSSESELEHLAQCIKSWGPHPQLTEFSLHCGPIINDMIPLMPQLLVTRLSKCEHLKVLNISDVNLHGSLSILMASPPPMLRALTMTSSFLQADDINHMVKAFREDKFTRMEKLDIALNPIGEVALDLLLQVIAIKPHVLKDLDICLCSEIEEGRMGEGSELSDHFANKWKIQLTNINVIWNVNELDDDPEEQLLAARRAQCNIDCF